MSTSYDAFMTPERVDGILNAPHTMEGLSYIIKILATTAYIPDKPQTFYNTELYVFIGIAHTIANELLNETTKE